MTKELFTRLKQARFPSSDTWTTPKDLTIGQFMEARYKEDKKRGVKYVCYLFEKHTATSHTDKIEVHTEYDDPIGWLWLALRIENDTKGS